MSTHIALKHVVLEPSSQAQPLAPQRQGDIFHKDGCQWVMDIQIRSLCDWRSYFSLGPFPAQRLKNKSITKWKYSGSLKLVLVNRNTLPVLRKLASRKTLFTPNFNEQHMNLDNGMMRFSHPTLRLCPYLEGKELS